MTPNGAPIPTPIPEASKIVATVDQITAQVATYTPAVIAAVQVAQATSASGEDKLNAVVNAILAGSQIGEAVPVPQVAAISALVNLTVSILKSLGVFHKKPEKTK